MTIVSPFLTFPNIGWWVYAYKADTIIFDAAEHFEKMTYRNRYRISGANNSILLSIPLVNGRNQHVPVKNVYIHNAERWQVQHWRTLISVYGRAPYFEHYEPELRPLFETQYERLIDFNKAGTGWVAQQLKMKALCRETDIFQKEYPADITDLRKIKMIMPAPIRHYYQVFEERIGFQPNLSILDLLFSEGPQAVDWLIG